MTYRPFRIIVQSILLQIMIIFAACSVSASIEPRIPAFKPDKISISDDAKVAHVVIKFKDNAEIRFQQNTLISKNKADIEPVNDLLERYFENRFGRLIDGISESSLDKYRYGLQNKSNKQLADMNGYYRINISDKTEAEIVVNNLNLQSSVEIAYIMPVVEPAGDIDPPTPDYTPYQLYRTEAPAGVDADYANTLPGGDGSGIKIVDLEGAWNFHHEDISKALGGHITGTLYDDQHWKDHGTAVTGVLVADDNSYGITGVCPGADIGMASIGGQAPAEAVMVALEQMEPGDLFVIEIGAPGPHYDFASNSSQLGYVCMEYFQAEFDAFCYAWAKGITVVQAAGNGQENYDDTEIYGSLFDTNYRNSHSIMVGASETPTYGSDRTYASYTNHGERVNLQGYGWGVYTTGYGSVFTGGGDENQYYASGFNGTSSATPIVAGAVACLQGYYQTNYNTLLSTDDIRQLLVATGSPQLGDLGKHIGPRPDLHEAINSLNAPLMTSSAINLDTSLAEGSSVTMDIDLYNHSTTSSIDFSISASDSLPIKMADWLRVSPETGTIPADGTVPVTVTFDAAILTADAEPYAGGLEISWGLAGQGLDSMLLVRALLTVTCNSATVCGDADNNGSVNNDDVDYLLDYITTFGAEPFCMIDADCDGIPGVTIADAVRLAENINSSGSSPDCNTLGSYQYNSALDDTLFLPNVSGIPADYETMSIPVYGSFQNNTDGFYFPVVPLSSGSTDKFYLDRIDDTAVSMGSRLNCTDGSSIMYGVEAMDGISFSGRQKLFDMVYDRLDDGAGVINVEITDRDSWMYAVEKDGQLYRPEIVYYSLGPSFLQLSDDEFLFSTSLGTAITDTFDILLTATSGSINWQADVSAPWIILNTYSGTTDQTVRITVDQSGVAAGWYSESITFTDSDATIPLEHIVTVNLFVSPSVTNVINVPGDYTTIPYAIAAADIHDTILVAPGTYDENVNFSGKAVKIISSGGAKQTFIQRPCDCSGHRIVTLDNIPVPGAELVGFTIRPTPGADNASTTGAIRVHDCNNVLISQNIITECYSTRPGQTVLAGVVEIVGSNVEMSENLLYANGSCVSTIQILDNSNCEIVNNTLDSNHAGITCYSSECTLTNNIITNALDYYLTGDFTVQDCNNIWNDVGYAEAPAPVGPNDISEDPMYCCQSKRDYSIHPDSPCNAGGACGVIGAFGVNYDDCDCFDQTPLALNAGLLPVDANGKVTSLVPEIYWSFFDTAVGTSQQAYELDIGSDTDWTVAELWDVGQVSSSDTMITYGGAPLDDHTFYYLRVRVYNGTDWGDWTELQFLTATSAIIYVPTNAATIQDAVDMALNGDTIMVEPGTYAERIQLNGRSIVLTSSDGPEITTITTSQNTAAIFADSRVAEGYVTISGFTFSGCKAGAIWQDHDSVIIENNIFADNFSGGSSYQGAAIRFYWPDSSIVRNNVFHGNVTEITNGGTISVLNNSRYEISGNVFYNNTGRTDIVVNGGILSNIGRINNNTICAGDDYGIEINNTSVKLINNIVCSADEIGVKVTSLFGDIVDDSYNCFYDNIIDINNDYDSSNVFENPMFIDPVGYDYSLQEGSPCVDAGSPDINYIDIDGTRSDIGALPRLMSVIHPLAINISYGTEVYYNYHVASQIPEFSWIFFDTIVGVMQGSYEIQVGTDALWDVAEMWESGEVVTSDTSAMYAGGSLGDKTVYYLRIRLNNGSGWGDWRQSEFLTRFSPIVYHVPSEKPTIQNAVGSILPGDSVIVAPGVYPVFMLNSDYPFVLISSDGPDVTTLTNSGDSALVTYNPSSYTGTRELSGFTLTGGLGCAVRVTSMPVNILNNVFTGNTSGNSSQYDAGALYLYGPGISHIRGNVFHDNTTNDTICGTITGLYCNGTIFENNIFYDNTAPAEIALYGNTHYPTEIINNTIFGADEYGALIGIYSQADAINNIVCSSGVCGMYQRPDIIGLRFNASYNCFFGNTQDMNFDPGDGNIFDTALFIDELARDFSLQPTSPCINAGNPDIRYLDNDGSIADIGALPYLSSVNMPLPVKFYYNPGIDSSFIESINPVISWHYFDTSVYVQSNYQLQIGTDNDWATAEMWDTGVVQSSDTTVEYSGVELEEQTWYYLRLRLSNSGGWGDWRESAFYIVTSFMCGDVNADDLINLGDILSLITYLYLDPPGPAPEPLESGDVNADGLINLADILKLIEYLYVEPFGEPPLDCTQEL